jgi:hypothetical protein
VVADRRLTIHTYNFAVTFNVKAKFRCPLPGKVEMSGFAVVILFLKLLRNAAAIAGDSLC